jgi:histidinol-phosphate aminotransferase
MHYRYDNVITLRTFSKVYGLAGIRIGYGFAHDALIRNLLKVKLPFEPSTLASAAGIGALADAEFLHRSLAVNAAGKKSLGDALMGLGFDVVPTEANFFCIPMESEAEVNRIFNGLLQHGVIIRPLKAFGLPHCLRITIGTQEQNAVLLDALRAVQSTVPAGH